jgi:transposase
VRKIGLDVHRDFCEVAIVEGGRVCRAGRVATEPAALALFAESLGMDDEVVLEATANALAIARLLEPHVSRVVLANPKAVKAATGLRAKTDKIDAATLGNCSPAASCRRCGRRMSRRASGDG